MADILDKFIEKAKENVANGYYAIKGTKTSKNPARVSLKQKIISQSFSLIAEIKHASPAGEYSFDNIDVERTALDFHECGADAVSVVVEPQIFKGDLRNIPMVKNATPTLPVLFKDFVISKEQINAAAYYGADCILLVMKVADRLGLDINALIDAAHKNNLEVLLECYDSDEMKRANETNADILGINNRDLRTLKVDLDRTKRILHESAEHGKTNAPVISESGIKTRNDAEFVRSCGVNGILVGTAIWKAANLRDKVKELKLK
ncbi:TPA: indole-3-glycerol-phosphate synthase [Candidatus Micrarchaeota archaeon]|nr:indole-3-glycerol-phosphate synthase [Candidatus Micrarchaeota archaeon]